MKATRRCPGSLHRTRRGSQRSMETPKKSQATPSASIFMCTSSLFVLGLAAQFLGKVSASAVRAAEVQANGDTIFDINDDVGSSVKTMRPTRVSATAKPRLPVTTVEKQPERMVVIGDVHGDIGAFEETLRIAGLIDDVGRWAGGETVLVQVGDIFDRGDDDLKVEEWLWILQQQAEASGGAVYHLLGNHEIMNSLGDLSSVSIKAYEPFTELDIDYKPYGNQLDEVPTWAWARIAAMAPHGPVANMLASHSVALKVGDTLFVHGGLRPAHLNPDHCGGASGMGCLENINRWTHEWLLGNRQMPRDAIWNRDSPLWTRFFSLPGGRELDAKAEKELQEVLDATGTVRMIVGHTPQEVGINSALGGRLWRTDTGMTTIIGGHPEALEIVDGVVTILTANGRVPGEQRACTAEKRLPSLPRLNKGVLESRSARSSVDLTAIAAAAPVAAVAAAAA